MDNEDLKSNPLDDYLPEPSVLDKATTAFVDQIAQCRDAVADAVTDIVTPKFAKTEDGQDVQITSEEKLYNICPDFGLGKTKQIILENMWKFDNDHWTKHETGRDIKNVREMVFAINAAVAENLAIDHFIGIQPTEHEICQIYQLHSKYKLSDADNEVASFEIVPQIVLTEERRLTSEWITAPDICDPTFGDFYRDIADRLAKDIAASIYHDFKSEVGKVANESNYPYGGDKRLSLCLYAEATQIAARSRRGFGNKIIVSNAIAAALLRSGALAVKDDHTRRYGHVNYVGEAGTSEIYVDSTLQNGEAFIFYKSNVSETDAGMFYCPRYLVKSGGIHVHPLTFAPTMALYTVSGYGYAYKTDKNGDVVDATGDYITKFQVDDLPYSIKDDKQLTELFDRKPLKSALVNTTELYGAHKL